MPENISTEAKPAQKPVNQWRTVLVAAWMSTGLFLTDFFSRPSGEIQAKMFSDLCWACMILAASVAGKSVFQHISNNGGLSALKSGLGVGKDTP